MLHQKTRSECQIKPIYPTFRARFRKKLSDNRKESDNLGANKKAEGLSHLETAPLLIALIRISSGKTIPVSQVLYAN
jgi:hypothetical protein